MHGGGGGEGVGGGTLPKLALVYYMNNIILFSLRQ